MSSYVSFIIFFTFMWVGMPMLMSRPSGSMRGRQVSLFALSGSCGVDGLLTFEMLFPRGERHLSSMAASQACAGSNKNTGLPCLSICRMPLGSQKPVRTPLPR